MPGFFFVPSYSNFSERKSQLSLKVSDLVSL
jgi:hypothetical protein